MNIKKETLQEILYLSNLSYCQCSEDLQNNLEKIHELIKVAFPNLKEKEN